MKPAERSAVAALSLLYAFRMLGLFLVLPVLALYAGDYSGSTPMLIGLAIGIYGLSQAAMQIPLGMLSDRIGRKPVIVGGLLVFMAGSLLAAAADSIQGVILGRFLQGAGAIASTLTALLADLTREQSRSKAMAAVGASIGLSFAAALVLSPLLAGWIGLEGIFVLTAVLAGLGLAIILFVVPTPRRLSPSAELRPLPQLFRHCLHDRELMRLNIGIFCLHFMLTAIFVVVPGLLEGQGLARQAHWQVYLPIMLISFLVMVPLMLAAERHHRVRQMFLAAVAALGLAMGGAVRLGGHEWVLLALLLLFFVAFNLLEANLPSLVSKTVNANAKGTAMGVYSSFQFFGAFCGGAGGGVLAQQFGPGAVFAACAALALLWLAVAWNMRPPAVVASYAVVLGRDEDAGATVERLRALDGVLELTVLAEEHLAYLRVSERFDRDQLQGFVLT